MNKTIDELREMFSRDVELFSKMYPLVSSGYIVPVSLPGLCPRCHITKTSFRSDFLDAHSQIEDVFLNELTFHLSLCRSQVAVYASGPEYLLPHGEEHYHPINGEEILAKLKLSKEDIEKCPVLLTKEQVANVKVNKGFVERVFKTVGFELTSSAQLKASFLSECDIEYEVLKLISKRKPLENRSQIMQRHLTCLVPFLSHVDAADLLKLRSDEGESFIIFRASLLKAINEYKISGDTLTDTEARMIFSDIIQPNLAKLELKLKNASGKFVKDTRREVLGWVGAISAGLYAGLLSADPMTGSLAFGAAKAASDFLNNTMSRSDIDEGIKENEMYFLWKVKKMTST